MGVPDPLLGSQVFVAFATSAVVLAILVRTKNKDLKSACIPAFVSGLFGVTEPALYGITITRPVMFTVSCIGSGISGAISGFLGFHYYQMAGLGLFEIPALLPTTDTGTVLAQAIICTAVTFIVTFIMAFVLYKEESQIEKTTAEDLLKNEIIASPLIGEIRPLSEAKDDAFASGAWEKVASSFQSKEKYMPLSMVLC